MNRTIITAAGGLVLSTLALTGCDIITGDRTSPVRVQDATAKPAELTPGLWTATPPNSAAGCQYAVYRNGYPVVRTQVYDSLPVYAWLPKSGTSDWGFTTTGCGTWVRVTK